MAPIDLESALFVSGPFRRPPALPEMFETNFASIDTAIVVAYLVGIALLGAYVNRYISGAADYLVGGRAAGTALSVATLVGTELGLVTLMYASMEGFRRGFSYFAIPLLGLTVMLFLGGSGFVISRLRRMRLTTIPEFFQRRYNRRVRIVAGVICVLAGVLNMGLFPKMGATFITFATGMAEGDGQPIVFSLASVTIEIDQTTLTINLITSALIVLVLAYTMLGGMVAVIVTDYVQFVLLSLALGAGLVVCLSSGEVSYGAMVDTWQSHGGTSAFNPLDPGSYGWVYMIWQVCVIFAAGICWAPGASRALTTQDEATTRRAFFLSAPGMFARMAIPGLWGIAAFVYVQHNADLAAYFSPAALEVHGERAAEAMPLVMGRLLPSGLLGLLVAGLLAAFMSTHDSYLLAWSSVVSQDIVAPLVGVERLSDAQSIRYTRWSILVIGLFLLIWGIWYQLPQSVWSYMAVTGTIYLSGAATALVGGMYWHRASSTGALLALVGGLTALLGLDPIQDATLGLLNTQRPQWLSEATIALATYAVCLLLFVVGSLVFPDAPQRPQFTTPQREP